MHTDPELLSLLALGEEVGTEEDRFHLRTCPGCAGELSELQRLVAMGRSMGTDSELTVPSPHVWARIREELALEPAVEAPADQSTGLPGIHLESSTADRAGAAVAATSSGSTQPRQSLLAVVAAALGGPSRGSAELVAHATLAPVPPGWSPSSGEAVIATDELGRRILQVALQADLPSSGVRQAWLVHRDDEKLKQTLGILDGPYGVWTVDQSIDLEQYAILDISQQGASDTEHSGHTIVRGQLTAVG